MKHLLTGGGFMGKNIPESPLAHTYERHIREWALKCLVIA